MVNQDELAICRKRGHKAIVRESGWVPCEYCGMWLKEERRILEREDEPPEAELDCRFGVIEE